ncbi:hypothetical protein [Brevibacillus laterosporus]|uniref:hypothetical protein n=1 Tax=Brevibacillus laterosporus TaxID=1465 RepID=UPI003D1CFB41
MCDKTIILVKKQATNAIMVSVKSFEADIYVLLRNVLFITSYFNDPSYFLVFFPRYSNTGSNACVF